MVSFSVFNELSLPLEQHKAHTIFIDFFKILAELKRYGLGTIRMNDDFKNYNILTGVTFQRFLGQQQDRDFKTKLISFIANTVIKIETPIVKKEEQEQLNILNGCEYFYNDQPTDGGLACADIWNTIAVSFSTENQWNCTKIRLTKNILKSNGSIEENLIPVKHASSCSHLKNHQDFFSDIEQENKLNITQDNFWNNKKINFPVKIEFCPEVKSQIKKLDKVTFQQAISILRDVETQRKLITDFNYTGESKTVHTNPKLKEMRMFTISGDKVFFENHIKSLPNAYRIYFLEQNGKIHIGYIGKHPKN